MKLAVLIRAKIRTSILAVTEWVGVRSLGELGLSGNRHVHRTCQDIALHLSGQIAKMGPFELLTEGKDLPVFAFKLRDDITTYSVFDLSERLRMRGWQVPAYTFPDNMTDTAVIGFPFPRSAARRSGLRP